MEFTTILFIMKNWKLYKCPIVKKFFNIVHPSKKIS